MMEVRLLIGTVILTLVLCLYLYSKVGNVSG